MQRIIVGRRVADATGIAEKGSEREAADDDGRTGTRP